jgi:hypothetical protein
MVAEGVEGVEGEGVGEEPGGGQPSAAGQAAQLEPLAKVLAGHWLLTRALTPAKALEPSERKPSVRALEEELKLPSARLPEARISVGCSEEGPSYTQKKS